MMINKRLIGTATGLLAALCEGSSDFEWLRGTAAVALAAVAIRFACTVGASRI